METSLFTCPRCFYTGPSTAAPQFCPRCGLPDANVAAIDAAPVDLKTPSGTFRVLDRLAVGSIANVYRCHFFDRSLQVEGVVKIARDSRANDLLSHEFEILTRLRSADNMGRFSPFLPEAHATAFVDGDDPATAPRRANVLRTHAEIHSIDSLYSLEEVQKQYPAGLDARDAAWIWRRLLSILGFVHQQQVIHGALLAPHVLIDPALHKLLLIDWCWAMSPGQKIPRQGGKAWHARLLAAHNTATKAVDLAMAGLTIVRLMGGDPATGKCPPSVDDAIQRYFQRCAAGSGPQADVWKLLGEFDRLIEILWGPRKFRVLSMPPHNRA